MVLTRTGGKQDGSTAIVNVNTGQLAAGFPFVVRDSLQALPHPMSIVGFDLSPVLTLCLFDGSSEGIREFLISVRISVPLLESGSSRL